MDLPGQGIKVLHEWNLVEDEGLVELLIHDGLLQDLACLLVNQVPTVCVDGESQERHGVFIRVEENVGVRADEENLTQQFFFKCTKSNSYCSCQILPSNIWPICLRRQTKRQLGRQSQETGDFRRQLA